MGGGGGGVGLPCLLIVVGVFVVLCCGELKEIFKVQFSDFCVMVSFQQYTTN